MLHNVHECEILLRLSLAYYPTYQCNNRYTRKANRHIIYYYIEFRLNRKTKYLKNRMQEKSSRIYRGDNTSKNILKLGKWLHGSVFNFFFAKIGITSNRKIVATKPYPSYHEQLEGYRKYLVRILRNSLCPICSFLSNSYIYTYIHTCI